MDVVLRTEKGRFNYRTAGIFLREGQLLVMQDERSPYYYLPGGRVALGETAKDALYRECQEELEITVQVGRPIWVVESFFTEDCSGEAFHELAFYFLVDWDDPALDAPAFTRVEGGRHCLRFCWQPLERLPELYLYPLFLKQPGRFEKLPPSLEHVVLYE